MQLNIKFLLSTFAVLTLSQSVVCKSDDSTTTSLSVTSTSSSFSNSPTPVSDDRRSREDREQRRREQEQLKQLRKQERQQRREDREHTRELEGEERREQRKRERELVRAQRRLQRDLERQLQQNGTVTLNKRAKKPRVCPVCNSCQKCDTKKGVCVATKTFASCVSGTKAGICYSGACNTKISLPPTPLPECKTYRCPASGTCAIVNSANGLPCGDVSAEVHSVCITGTCSPVMDGLNTQLKNVGCWLVRDNIRCDTNEIFTDKEFCVNNVCTRLGSTPRFPAVSMPSRTCTLDEVGLPCTMTSTVAPLPFHYYCVENEDGLAGTCKPFIDALTLSAPHYNVGCQYMKDGTDCDTNDDILDGEKCLNDVCVYPDGTYDGLLPGQALSRPKTTTTNAKAKTTTTKTKTKTKTTTTNTKTKTTTTRVLASEPTDSIKVKFQTDLHH